MPTAPRSIALHASLLSLALAAGSGCGGGSSSSSGSAGGTSFRMLAVSVPNGGTWQINRPIEFTFSQDVDITSVNLNTINISQPSGIPAAGEFVLKDARTVVFQPACPTLGNYSDAGLLPNGVTYLVNVLGAAASGPTVLSTAGRSLTSSQTVQFATPISELNDPTILFLDPQLGPPVAIVRVDPGNLNASYLEVGGDASVGSRVYFEPRALPDPDLGADVPAGFKSPLNLYSDASSALAVVLAINQPVDPSDSNLAPANVDLQYLAATATWISIPHTVELESNCVGTGAQIRVTPTGILPQGRQLRVVLSSNFRDLVGQTNITPAVVVAFEVDVATNPGTSVAGDQGDAVLEEFELSAGSVGSREDPAGIVTSPVAIASHAIWSDGQLEASFDFDGTGGPGGAFDWVIGNDSLVPETIVLDTTFAVITNGDQTLSQTVINGRVDVRSLWVKKNGTLIIQGAKPCTILASGTIPNLPVGVLPSGVLIEGQVRCNGANNRGVVSFSTTNIPEPGSAGQAGGGTGGTGSYLTTQSTPEGGHGEGAFRVAGGGGRGGESGFSSSPDETLRRPGGGGGGVFGKTQFELTRAACPDQRVIGMDAETGFLGRGNGALHGVGSTALGGAVGASPFRDANANNDFWGTMVTAGANPQVVIGELDKPWAGAGGGAGGDACTTTSFPTTPFTTSGDEKGAGAGGGGGSLTILALGDIRIGTTGAGSRARIEVNGGCGGGGENTFLVNRIGGGSGGGSGGHLVLQSASQIDLSALTSVSTTGLGQGMLLARGGQGGAGQNEVGGARFNGVETLASQDGLPANAYPNTTATCGVAATGDYAAAGNPPQFSFSNTIGNTAGSQVCAGGDGGPGVIQLHTPTVTDIKLPLGTNRFRDICFPLPVGVTPANAATQVNWNRLLPIFGRRSFGRSSWIPLGSATVAPGSLTPDQVRYFFAGTNPATGTIDRAGAGSTATVLELPAILAGVLANEPTEPFVTADDRTVVFDAGALADDIYKRNPSLCVGFALKMTAGAVSTSFDVAAATYDLALDQLRLTVADSGAPLAGYAPGDTAELIPRFFRVSTDGVADSYPASSEITIRFQAAPANAFGAPDEANASAFVTDITALNSTTYRFVRFQVEFDIQADAGSLSPTTPIPALEFLSVPFRF